MIPGWSLCGWCEDSEPGHRHYFISLSKAGKWLGNLTPDNRCSRQKVDTMLFSASRAAAIMNAVNREGRFAAKAKVWK